MEEEKEIRLSNIYPEIFPISLSHLQFPYSESEELTSEMLFGFNVTPFIGYRDFTNIKKTISRSTVSASKIARCSMCSGYINPFCDATSMKWNCSLCGTFNLFPKSMLRYRQVDLSQLPELQNLMIDYPLPISTKETSKNISEIYSCPAIDRPFVHVFLVQESMSLDCIQATIQALEIVADSLHPDIEIIFLTFSNRIGVYRLNGSTSKSAFVQYVHFSTNIESEVVLDGYENSSFLRNISENNVNPTIENTVHPLLPLNEVITFGDACLPIGLCRKNFQHALSSLHDASPSASSSPNSICGPLVMIGPILEEVISWITDNDQKSLNNQLQQTQSSQTQNEVGGLIGLLAGLGLGVNSTSNNSTESDNSDLYHGWNIGENYQRNNSGIDFCTGVELHLIVSTPQDLKYGCHSSVSSSGGLDETWMKKIATKCANRGLGVNIWGLADYESSKIGLSELYPLAELTGGKISRFVLGVDPSSERKRFSADLTRSLTTQIASKCLLKMRSSSSIKEHSSKMLGFGILDDTMPEIYKIASCRPTSTFAYTFHFQNDGEISHDTRVTSKLPNLILQIAFSYNSLVEVSEEEFLRRGSRSNSLSNEIYENDLKSRKQNNSDFDTSVSDENNESNQDSSADFSILQDSYNAGDDLEVAYLKNIASGLELNPLYEEFIRYRLKKIQKSIKLEKSPTIYNSKCRLVAIRRLRVITCMIEVTTKIPRLLQSVHTSTMMSLICREALLQKDSKASLEFIKKKCNDILISICQMIYFHRFQPSRSDDSHQITVDISHQIINEALSVPQVIKLLQLTYGILHILTQSIETKDYTQESQLDIFTETVSLLLSSDPYIFEKILYPEFREVRSDNLINFEKKLKLKRESVVTSGKSLFLVDSVHQITLYRTISSSETTSEPLSPIYRPDDLSSPEKYYVDVNESPYLRSNSWLMNDISRRLKLNPFIPKFNLSEAGKISSTLFSDYLIEDNTLVFNGFNGFIDNLIQDLHNQLITTSNQI